MDRQKKKLQDEARRIDLHVGKRLRLAREYRGITQKELGQEMGLAFQQIQKYEQGVNRVSAGKLCQFSRILDIPFQFFFYELEEAAHIADGPTLSTDVLEAARMLENLPGNAKQTFTDMLELLTEQTSTAHDTE